MSFNALVEISFVGIEPMFKKSFLIFKREMLTNFNYSEPYNVEHLFLTF